ncbi:class A beta-lactamase [Rhizobium sp. PAMB 3182]
MTTSLSRRQALAASLLVAPALTALSSPASASNPGAESRLAELESRHAGRICVRIVNLGTGKTVSHRADEPILMCSTFKAILAAQVLKAVDEKADALDSRIRFTKKDVSTAWSPVAEKRVGGAGMTIAELCEAAVCWSDNTAANLLLKRFGGPKALTAFFRSIGDSASRLDRMEPGLNYHEGPDDQRDTTTAAAMAEDLRRLLFTDVLSSSSRAQFAAWLIANKTGDARLRAGLPARWLVGDKTGTNGKKYGNANDIAVAWPTDRPPVIVTAYCEIPKIESEERDAVIAEIGRIASAV